MSSWWNFLWDGMRLHFKGLILMNEIWLYSFQIYQEMKFEEFHLDPILRYNCEGQYKKVQIRKYKDMLSWCSIPRELILTTLLDSEIFAETLAPNIFSNILNHKDTGLSRVNSWYRKIWSKARLQTSRDNFFWLTSYSFRHMIL